MAAGVGAGLASVLCGLIVVFPPAGAQLALTLALAAEMAQFSAITGLFSGFSISYSVALFRALDWRVNRSKNVRKVFHKQLAEHVKEKLPSKIQDACEKFKEQVQK